MNVFVVLVLIGSVLCNDEDLRKIDRIYSEPLCNSEGGICVYAPDCPPGQLADPGLCPEQRSKGVECCYGMSVKETRCRKLGGECTSSYCNPRIINNQAKDCLANQHCCILVT